LIKRLWIREVRRAARRASAPFARQVALGCCAAAIGAMAASLLPLNLDDPAAQAVRAALWAIAGYLAIWTVLFFCHLWRYRSNGFGDRDWLARHDDSDPHGAVFLELVRRSGGGPAPNGDLALCVKSHGNSYRPRSLEPGQTSAPEHRDRAKTLTAGRHSGPEDDRILALLNGADVEGRAA
jgi:hypothetical protein